jgi:hypothetical protein
MPTRIIKSINTGPGEGIRWWEWMEILFEQFNGERDAYIFE